MDFYFNQKLIGTLNDNILKQRTSDGKYVKREVIHLPLSIYSVVCNHCGKIYDIRKTEVTLRYNNITEFKAPCCGELCDDRPFKKDFTFLKNI